MHFIEAGGVGVKADGLGDAGAAVGFRQADGGMADAVWAYVEGGAGPGFLDVDGDFHGCAVVGYVLKTFHKVFGVDSVFAFTGKVGNLGGGRRAETSCCGGSIAGANAGKPAVAAAATAGPNVYIGGGTDLSDFSESE
ncbi:hypothetical protein DIU31_003425 [Mucilaginibacter rubeus]|uniref:Uncharacterized protein n=1 Tax=Mucilaginibacter rubeus TaxID=2027860 RepID=A0AAE6MGM1_9SPHI|nr:MULTISPECIES: hypothetical protein [Mucilaginibacter]QEM02613.1 hypothetical protein DIU31_003425 [Mucilaginibacter rubeus]QEM15234.1 hypothetical protein DIU38_003465 [Mucilaginibacter gossypii]QTE42042.1 hypothetical protein J3L19_24345 [Mucilaginibacter rubeus]QTE48643.1 hypothetical protein J3L21_24320 [Mucilaginibacter rubeus]QTE60029.1 hypothetical protein J3L23_15950 [Mucilaginibacter rubeus]